MCVWRHGYQDFVHGGQFANTGKHIFKVVNLDLTSIESNIYENNNIIFVFLSEIDSLILEYNTMTVDILDYFDKNFIYVCRLLTFHCQHHSEQGTYNRPFMPVTIYL